MVDDTDFIAHLRETVTILRPMPSVVPRGNNSPREQQPTRSIRLQPEVLLAVDEASELLGMSRSSFMSWCAYLVAKNILQQKADFDRKLGRSSPSS